METLLGARNSRSVFSQHAAQTLPHPATSGNETLTTSSRTGVEISRDFAAIREMARPRLAANSRERLARERHVLALVTWATSYGSIGIKRTKTSGDKIVAGYEHCVRTGSSKGGGVIVNNVYANDD